MESQLIKGQNRNEKRLESQRDVQFQVGDAVWVYQFFHRSTAVDDKRVKKCGRHLALTFPSCR